MKKQDIIDKLAKKYGLSSGQIREIVDSPFNFARDIITNMPLKDIRDKEEFDKYKTNFGFKYLGILYTKWEIVNAVNTRMDNFRKNRNNKDDKK